MADIAQALIDGSKDIEEVATEILKSTHEMLYSPEMFALGLGLTAWGTTGFMGRHPEIAMFLAAEASDIAEEFLGNISNVADVDVNTG